MDEYFVLQGITCVWNEDKARINPQNPDGVTSQQAAEAVKQTEVNAKHMKVEVLKRRLDKNRPMTSITIRMPEDVIDDLKRIAPLLGFSGYQPLVRTYIGQGLRADLERLEGDTVLALIDSLKRHGVSDEVLQSALQEVIPPAS